MGRPRRLILPGVAVLVIVLGLTFPLWAGALGAWLAQGKMQDRLGLPVVVGKGRAGIRGLALSPVTLGDTASGRAALGIIDVVQIPWGVVFGRGVVVANGARFRIDRGGANDNITALETRLRGRPTGAASGTSLGAKGSSGLALELHDGAIKLTDETRHLEAVVGGFDLSARVSHDLTVSARQLSGHLRVRDSEHDPTFGAAAVTLNVALDGFRPHGIPKISLTDGFAQVMRTLGLTGISGVIGPAKIPPPTGVPALDIELTGSYGGAKEKLWTAKGTLSPPASGRALSADLQLRAARFSLERIADVLPPQIIEPSLTSIDAALDLIVADGRLTLKGNLDVSGLSLQHEALASEPIIGVDLGLRLDATVDPVKRRLDLALFEGRLQKLVGRIKGSIELGSGTFSFRDGNRLNAIPRLDISFEIPRLPCQRALDSLPAPIVPRLQGFNMQGTFESALRARIDFSNLDALALEGKVGIDGCQVTKAPEDVEALSGSVPVSLVVEVPALDAKTPEDKDLLALTIGAENPDFVPFDGISPHLINAIMTTEDSGFFKHRGWVSSGFAMALRRNLAGGGFRLGASSITMQMVKNVLLSREKTLSRKLQELFLVWHLEHQLTKERILELYFNAIEFGPRIHGIGPASRHYFGKEAALLTPLEAAFFSSILPSPKRRYIQYCHGTLFPPWERYVRRILAKIHERGRLTDAEYAAASAESIAFDVGARTQTEKECLDWVKRITVRPEPDPPADPD